MNDYKEVKERVCPHCGVILNINGNSMANHIRWCKQNPKYYETLTKTVNNIKRKLKEKNKTSYNNYIIKCENCQKEFSIICSEKNYKSGKYRKTCCNECTKILTSIKGKDKKANTWVSKNSDKNIRICKFCGKEFITKTHKKYCSDECKKRQRFYENNKDKDIKNIYYKMCKFNFALNEYPQEFNFELINSNGWYKAKNRGDNLHGVSRDHIISIKYGYENGIDPYIISHPANCQLLIHTDNESKGSKCDMSINELIEKINKWNKIYGKYPNKICYLLKDFKVTL